MPVKIVNKSLFQTVGKWFLESPDQSLNLFWSLSIRPKASVQKTIKLHFQLISTVNLEVFRNIYFIGMWGKWKLSELNIDAKKTILLKKRSTICIDTDDNLVPGCVCRELKWDPWELAGGIWGCTNTVSSYPSPYNPSTLHPYMWRMHWTESPTIVHSNLHSRVYSRRAICGCPLHQLCRRPKTCPRECARVVVGCTWGGPGAQNPGAVLLELRKCSPFVESENNGNWEIQLPKFLRKGMRNVLRYCLPSFFFWERENN